MVIDLDAHRPASRTPARRRRLPVRPAAIVAVLLVALTLGGSAAPLPGLRRVLAVGNTSGVFALARAALFTADFGPAPGRQATVRRHPLDGSSPRWSAALPQTVGSLDVVEPARVLAVGPAQVLMTTSVDSPQTTFLDSGTGEILWSTRTESVLRLAETSVLMTGSAGLRHADLRTGAPLRSPVHLDPGDPAAGPARLRPDRTAPGRTWVQVTGRHHGVRTVGALATVAPGRCAASADHVACPTSSGRLAVWRIPN